ncbi:MAG: sugar ABC transporter permease, partial [Proteobacteria bacterium]
MATESLAAPVAVTGPKIKSELMQQRVRAARWFLLPMLIALAVVAGWPLLRSIYFSFTDARLNTLYDAQWIGIGNYLRWTVLESGAIRWRGVLADPDWWNAVWNTVRFAFWSVLWESVLGMIVALVLNAEFKGRGFVRAAILIPWAIPTIVSAKMWSWMLNDQFGILNDLGMRLGLLSQKVAWTASADTAMQAVLVVDIWKTTPFMALLILAGLQM